MKPNHWRSHEGGAIPVPKGTMVNVRFRDDDQYVAEISEEDDLEPRAAISMLYEDLETRYG